MIICRIHLIMPQKTVFRFCGQSTIEHSVNSFHTVRNNLRKKSSLSLWKIYKFWKERAFRNRPSEKCYDGSHERKFWQTNSICRELPQRRRYTQFYRHNLKIKLIIFGDGQSCKAMKTFRLAGKNLKLSLVFLGNDIIADWQKQKDR